MAGPTLPISVETFRDKYSENGETFEAVMRRIARTLDDGGHQGRGPFLNAIMDQRFLPAGRVQSSAGTQRLVASHNCFVSGTIADSFTDGPDSIMMRALEAAQTMRLGGGIGYDFSTLRPNKFLIKKLGSGASGPVSFMEIFHATCKTVASAGNRRGAQMAILRVDHPDIMQFITCKTSQMALSTFNISVAITDKFMECLEAERGFDLRFEGRVIETVDPAVIWDAIMRNTWNWAEPGVVFIDTMNRMNNLWYAERIAATNPCSEQPLPPNGACLLGSFNLPKYITPSRAFDYAQFRRDIYPVVRAMDNVNDTAIYPLEAQKIEAQNKRRMGLGVTGLANAVEAMGHQYGTQDFINIEESILDNLNLHCYDASMMLAREKGSFPLYIGEHFLGSKFIKNSLPPDLISDIRRYGIRNSHLTSIAPTGTISLVADNVSSSIEPVFNYSTKRVIQMPEGPRTEVIEDYGYRVFGTLGKTTNEVTVDDHLNVLLAAQKYVDSAVSKTCNVGDDVSFDDFKDIYLRAYRGGAKGCTTFRKAGMKIGILQDANTNQGESCKYDPSTGQKTCD